MAARSPTSRIAICRRSRSATWCRALGCRFISTARNRQLVTGTSRQVGASPILQSNITWYVNGTTGDDTLYDGTTPTVVPLTIHGPFKTLQRAANEVIKYNQNGYDQTVYVADGTYAGPICQATNGVGFVNWSGNQSTPQNVHINSNGFSIEGGFYRVSGLYMTASSAGDVDCFGCSEGVAVLTNNVFGSSNRFHIAASWNARILLSGGYTSITGGGAAHLFAGFNANLSYDPQALPSVNLLDHSNFTSAFAVADHLGIVEMIYANIINYANGGGQSYAASMNGCVTGGGGQGYFPGSGTGTLSTGGQYQ